MQFRLWVPFVAVFAIAFGLASAPARAAADVGIQPDELHRIELLIAMVEHSTDRRFIRNGTSYDASTAARFLRLKWAHDRDRVHSAEDFVREIGSRSGTTGNHYRVRNPDGSEEDSAVFLTRLLATRSPIASK